MHATHPTPGSAFSWLRGIASAESRGNGAILSSEVDPSHQRGTDMSNDLIVAGIGVAGVAVGGAIQYFGQSFDRRQQTKLDKKRMKLLETMLTDADLEWRTLATCARVIGADEGTTKRLLISIGARCSEIDDSNWALLSRKPFPKHIPG